MTSPPYFAGKEYEETLGEGRVPVTYLEYLDLLRGVFAECVRKLEPGDRDLRQLPSVSSMTRDDFMEYTLAQAGCRSG